ncbi:MAG: family 43 glycosylhydrolase [Chloroflexi bacterium]|nr:family 43 glycosylhydrolase [Chloroflexota bacterium]
MRGMMRLALLGVPGAQGGGADTVAPTLEITTSAPDDFYESFTATFTFSKEVFGFEAGDVTLSNATLSDFTAVSGSVYTALITASSLGAVTVDVAAGVCADAAGNLNEAAVQLRKTAVNWWLVAGITADQIYGAWQAKGAGSLAASYVNLADPGTHDLTEGVAPNYTDEAGWEFTGTQYLNTGFTPVSSGRITMFIKVGGVVGDSITRGYMGYFYSSIRSVAILKEGGTNKAAYRYGASGAYITSESAVLDGVLGLYGQLAYLDGDNIGDTGVSSQVSNMQEIRIGTAGTDENPLLVNGAKCNVQAAILFNQGAMLTTDQITALSDAMARLTDPGGATLDEDWRDPGEASFSLQPKAGVTQPVLTKAFVTDIDNMDSAAAFVADPFVIKDGGVYYLFFEAFNGAALLAYGTSSNLLDWTYGSQLTLNGAPWETSYPFVFKADGKWWLIHNVGIQTPAGAGIRLYRPKTWPHDWTEMNTLITVPGVVLRDVSIFQWSGRWYIIAGDQTNITCRLFHADSLYGSVWAEHPASPILAGADNSRPAGRPIVRPGVGVDILLQDGDPYYGICTRIFRLSNLTETTCSATELATSPVLEPSGTGWNSHGMHHLDRVDSSFSIVDGFDENGVYGIGVYEDVPE